MSNRKSLANNSFWNWFFCIAFPFVVGYALSSFVLLIYILLLVFLFEESEGEIVKVLLFLYCTLALPYSIFAYFRSGIAIARSIVVGWQYFVAKFCFKNPIVIILLVFCLVAASKFYQPPELGFSELELVEKKVVQLQTKLNQTVSEKIEPLNLSLTEELTQSNQVRNSKKYEEFYTQPFPGRASQEKVDRIDRIYWRFKNQVKSEEKYVNETETKLEEIKGSISSLGEEVDSLISDLKNICSSANNSPDIDEEIHSAKKNEYCKKLRDTSLQLKESTNYNSDSFQLFSNDLRKIEENVLDANRFLVSWNHWLAAQKKVVDTRTITKEELDKWIADVNYELDSARNIISNLGPVLRINIPEGKKELLRRVEALEAESENLKRQISEYEKTPNLTKEIVNHAEKNLSRINNLTDEVSQAKEDTKVLADDLRKASDEIQRRTTVLYDLYLDGENLLKAPRFTQGALNQKPTAESKLKIVYSFRVNELNFLKKEIQNELNSYKSLQKSIFQRLGETRLSVTNTQDRLKYYLNSAEKSLLISTIKWFAIYAAIMGVAIVSIWYYYKKMILKEKRGLGSQDLNDLLVKIKDAKGFVKIRLGAIQVIYENQNNFPDEGLQRAVDLLKNTVKEMEKRKSDEDLKVNAELRKVAESLELRLMEKRSFS